MLEVKNIKKSFDKEIVLDDVSFTLLPHEITGIVGRNGSGKTTLLKVISKIYEKDEGSICFDNKNIYDFPKEMENIAFLPDNFDYFPNNDARFIIANYKIVYPNFDEGFAIRELERNNISLTANSRKLSKGNKTILGLIMVLATNAKVLLVDEVLDGIDVVNREIILRYLIDAREEDRAILISSHELKELSGITDKIIYISLDGKIDKITEANEKNLNKVQIVVKDGLPPDIRDRAVIRSEIGRVYTVLIAGEHEKLVEELIRPDITQFDILPLAIEDHFFWEKERGKK